MLVYSDGFSIAPVTGVHALNNSYSGFSSGRILGNGPILNNQPFLSSVYISQYNFTTLTVTPPGIPSLNKGIISTVIQTSVFLSSGQYVLRATTGSGIVAQFRCIQTVNTFQEAYDVWELQAGGTQVATFQTHGPLLEGGERWSLVWDASGPNVTAAIYRNDEMLLAGTGGTQGSGASLVSVSYGLRAPSGTTGSLHSLTIWGDPVGDLPSATSPHTVSAFAVVAPQSGTYNSWQSFYNSSSPSGTLSERIGNSNNSYGAQTSTPADPLDLSFAVAHLDKVGAIYGISPWVRGLGAEGLSSLATKLTSGESESSEVITDVTSLTTFAAGPVAIDPQTGSPWQAPTYADLATPDGDGGFESGTSFAANGWTAIGPATGANLFLGPLGALSGSRGAYLSGDGGATSEVTLSTTANSVALYKDITVPEGAVALLVMFQLKLEVPEGSQQQMYPNINIMGTDTLPPSGSSNSRSWAVGGTLIGTTSNDIGYYINPGPGERLVTMKGVYQLSGESELRISLHTQFRYTNRAFKFSVDDIYIGAIMSYPDFGLRIEARDP